MDSIRLPLAAGQPDGFRQAVEEPSHEDARLPAVGPADPPPQVAPVLAGVCPVDVPALRDAVDRFFAQVDQLGQDLIDSAYAGPVVWWLVAGAAAFAGVGFPWRRHVFGPAAPVVLANRADPGPRPRGPQREKP